ncbi:MULTISPECIES: MarR family winged helix-turn-helix transcriptional regulator [Mycobacteriaceae]|uniref:MarR family transcriptional regulator n=1 Tax=Mycolicibacterium parafortuitum TaxID=39692 RepID=A0ACC6MCA8_MYCPF|nr:MULTISPECIES: MarR family transcriptional regulator [Mycobacteriaceae]MCK5753382.1 MarR family transcriptional regulator [Mycobacterium sp.]MEC9322413.1 MarR family transcriptional regulator [Actinomycetota bacterium]MDZ5084581.1 MarR family transcriptional regulator [Mycolicibacterium parafortuitum]GFM20785.1 MarR family regulatory protein [Mycobacterium sp. PO1]GFM26813.1 MarR family regulatory protein [Mycobacterium sp. PO2]
MSNTTASDVDAISEMLVSSADLMWRHLADRDELSASATLVLNRLHREGPMRVTALAEAEGASQSGMTQLVQRMERQGLLERCGDPDDGRACLVQVGEEGRRLWDARSGIRKQRISGLLAGLSDDDQVSLWLAARVASRLLDQMREIADTSAVSGGVVGG